MEDKVKSLITKQLYDTYNKFGINCNETISNSIKSIENNIVNLTIKSYSDKELNIKTFDGVKKAVVFTNNNRGSDSIILAKYILSYILNSEVKSSEYFLETNDIGLVVNNGEVYCNIELDIARWLIDNKADKFLFDLACGYKPINQMINFDTFIDKYIKLYKGYEVKRKMVGGTDSLKTAIENTYCHIETQDFSCDISSWTAEIHDMIEEHVANAIKYNYNWYVSDIIYDSVIYGGNCIDEVYEEIMKLYKLSLLVDKNDHINKLYDKIKPVYDTYEKQLDMTDIKNSGIGQIALDFDISLYNMLERVLNGISFSDIIRLGIEERDTKGGYKVYITNYGDNISGSYRNILNKYIRENYLNEK